MTSPYSMDTKLTAGKERKDPEGAGQRPGTNRYGTLSLGAVE